jgi:hypothetical protein
VKNTLGNEIQMFWISHVPTMMKIMKKKLNAYEQLEPSYLGDSVPLV